MDDRPPPVVNDEYGAVVVITIFVIERAAWAQRLFGGGALRLVGTFSGDRVIDDLEKQIQKQPLLSLLLIGDPVEDLSPCRRRSCRQRRVFRVPCSEKRLNRSS